jgi:hypothetical protein
VVTQKNQVKSVHSILKVAQIIHFIYERVAGGDQMGREQEGEKERKTD